LFCIEADVNSDITSFILEKLNNWKT